MHPSWDICIAYGCVNSQNTELDYAASFCRMHLHGNKNNDHVFNVPLSLACSRGHHQGPLPECEVQPQ